MTTYIFGRHSDDYATYRPGPPKTFYDRLDALAKIDGSLSLDLATGPGTIALALAARGFEMLGQFCYHRDEELSHARWRGRMRTCSGVGSGNLSPNDVQRFDAALSDLLRDKYPDPMVVEHRVWSVVVRKPA